MKNMKKLSIFFALMISMSAFAQDRYFGQTYTSNVLPKGGVDLEVWHTSRMGRSTGFYHGMDQRLELEFGLGNKLQTAFYFNKFTKMTSNSLNEIETKSEIGFSNEWKYLLSRPTSKVGVALYGEFGVKGDELEWEGKLIIDRAFGKNLFAFNLVGEVEQEFEFENGKFKLETEKTPVELDFGYMRFVHPNLGLGVELRNNNSISKGKWENSVLFAGPTVNYRNDRWFIVANFLPQVRNLRRSSASPAKQEYNDREKVEARILLGISL